MNNFHFSSLVVLESDPSSQLTPFNSVISTSLNSVQLITSECCDSSLKCSSDIAQFHVLNDAFLKDQSTDIKLESMLFN